MARRDDEQDPTTTSHLSSSQQAMIWFLVVAVGVLFGMAPVLAMLKGPSGPSAYGVSQADARRLQETERRLLLMFTDRDQTGPWEEYARRLRFAAFARAEGLEPRGAALEAELRRFLAKPINDRDTHETLAAYEGNRAEGVSRRDLTSYLQVQAANEALVSRYVVDMLTPQAAGHAVAALERNRIVIDEVLLDVTPLIPLHREAVAADSDTIERTYRELQTTRFRVAPQRIFTAFVADGPTIAGQLQVDPEAVERAYQQDRERWRIDPDPEQPDDTEPRYRPLDEVRDTLVAELRSARSEQLGRQLGRSFQRAIGTLGSPQEITDEQLIDLAAETRLLAEEIEDLAEDVAMQLRHEVVIQEPASDLTRVMIPGFGEARVDTEMFQADSKPGSWFQPVLSNGDGTHLLLRLERSIDASFRPLDEVRDQVIDHLAARAAWPSLIERAQMVAARIADEGDNDLRAFFAEDEVQQRWGGATATESRLPMLARLAPPPSEPGGRPGTDYPALRLASEARPVVLAAANRDQNQLPALRLIQVRRIDSSVDALGWTDPEAEPDGMASFLVRYGTMGHEQRVQRYLMARFYDDIEARLRQER